jgi:integrase
MARAVKDTRLDSRAARAKLAVRHEPYWRLIEEGSHLGYRRGARGGTWIARFKPEGGTYVKRTLGKADDTEDADGERVFSFRQAQEAARRWFGEQRALGAGGGVAKPGPYTVANALDDYTAHLAHEGKKSVADARYRADRQIKPDLGDVEVSRLTTARIRAWHKALADRPALARTKAGADVKHRAGRRDPAEAQRARRSSANRSLTTLKAALNFAWQEGRVASDSAWRRVTPFKAVDAARVDYLSADEVQRLVNAAPGDFRELVRAALFTGGRYGELTRLRVGDYSADVGTVTIRESKSGKPRHVPLTADAVAFFERITAGRQSTDLMLKRADGNAWGKSHQQRPLRAACTAAGIDRDVTFHALRHTFATSLAHEGVPLFVIAECLGHRDTRMVEKHYGHWSHSYVASTVRAAGLGYAVPDEPTNVTTLRAGGAG